MERLTRIVGGVLLAIGAVVAVHTIIEPLYHVSSAASPYSPMWRIIDPRYGRAAGYSETSTSIMISLTEARARSVA